MDQCIVFFDIDGTILGWDKHIPADTIEAIHRLRRNGHLAVINTGRPFSHVEPSVVDIGFDGYIASCGAHILLDGESVQRRRPSAEECRETIELVRECRMTPVYESEEGMFFDFTQPLHPYFHREMEHYAQRGFDVHYDIDTPGFRFDKFCVFTREDSDPERFVREASRYFEVIGREGAMMELPAKGCNKGLGIEAFSRHTGIPLERCWAIGDGKNDLPMFRTAGHSVIMGSGDREVFSQVEYITTGLDEGGIANALAYYGLI